MLDAFWLDAFLLDTFWLDAFLLDTFWLDAFLLDTFWLDAFWLDAFLSLIHILRDMDHVITTRELAMWLKEEGIDIGVLEDEAYDSLMGPASGAGVIFGNTGGVMEAAARTRCV